MTLRQLHLYLGCLFAPLLIFFAATGAYQTFGLHEASRPPRPRPTAGLPGGGGAAGGGELSARPPQTAEPAKPAYQPYGWVEALASVHLHQKLPGKVQHPAARVAFRVIVLLMALGLITTTILGVKLAFQHLKRRRQVWACLVAGVVVPLLLVVLVSVG